MREMIKIKLIEWFESLAEKLTKDKPHLFVFQTRDKDDNFIWRNIYLTPYN